MCFDACESDAELIISLGSDGKTNRYFSGVSDDWEDQRLGLRLYALATDQACFITTNIEHPICNVCI
jgi:hypothetical protein